MLACPLRDSLAFKTRIYAYQTPSHSFRAPKGALHASRIDLDQNKCFLPDKQNLQQVLSISMSILVSTALKLSISLLQHARVPVLQLPDYTDSLNGSINYSRLDIFSPGLHATTFQCMLRLYQLLQQRLYDLRKYQ